MKKEEVFQMIRETEEKEKPLFNKLKEKLQKLKEMHNSYNAHLNEIGICECGIMRGFSSYYNIDDIKNFIEYNKEFKMKNLVKYLGENGYHPTPDLLEYILSKYSAEECLYMFPSKNRDYYIETFLKLKPEFINFFYETEKENVVDRSVVKCWDFFEFKEDYISKEMKSIDLNEKVLEYDNFKKIKFSKEKKYFIYLQTINDTIVNNLYYFLDNYYCSIYTKKIYIIHYLIKNKKIAIAFEINRYAALSMYINIHNSFPMEMDFENIHDKNACSKFIIKNTPLENVGENSIFLGGSFYDIEWVDNNAQKM